MTWEIGCPTVLLRSAIQRRSFLPSESREHGCLHVVHIGGPQLANLRFVVVASIGSANHAQYVWVQAWDSMARKIYAPVVKSTRLSQISTNLRQFLVVGTCLKIKY